MTALTQLIIDDDEIWLSDLPQYQSSAVTSLLSTGLGYEEAASAWMSGSTASNTAPFGTGLGLKLFFDSFLDELHDFLCIGRNYEQERNQLLSGFKPGQAGMAAYIAAAIAPQLDAAPSFLAPAVALLLCAIGKLSLGAWCRMQSERRNQNPTESSTTPDGAPGDE
ncbi:hypothetical protein ACFXG9_00865 [Streptomyces mirabilis]|uniref:hypothetical protein n=1 Tax=Streptomyces mirabilis TaxID=68239 RepID=UPI00367548E8